MNGVFLAWLVEAGIVTYRDLTSKKSTNTIAGLPLPADYLATFIVFGSLSLLAQAESARTFASVTAWGFVGSTLLNLFNPAVKAPATASASSTPAATTTGPAGPVGPVSATAQRPAA